VVKLERKRERQRDSGKVREKERQRQRDRGKVREK